MKRLRDAELQANGRYNKREVEARRKAKRPVHHFKRLSQVCDECQQRPALWSCTICGHFCVKCLNKTHSKGARAAHAVTEFIQLTKGPAWERDMAEEEERKRAAERAEQERLQDAMDKLDILRAARLLQRNYRRRKKRKQLNVE